MTASVHPLHLAGRWRSGFDGHHVCLLHAPGRERVKLTATMDLGRHLHDAHRWDPDLRCVAVLPGNTAHKDHLARLLAAHRKPIIGDWYEPAPAMKLAERIRQRLATVDAGTGREAILTVLADLDPSIADLQRLWRNGTSTATIAALSSLPQRTVEERVRHLRAMGYELSYRQAKRLRAA